MRRLIMHFFLKCCTVLYHDVFVYTNHLYKRQAYDDVLFLNSSRIPRRIKMFFCVLTCVFIANDMIFGSH